MQPAPSFHCAVMHDLGSHWSHPWLAIVDWSHLCHASFTLCLRQSVVGTHPAPSYCLIGKHPGNLRQLTSLPGTHRVQEFLLTQGDYTCGDMNYCPVNFGQVNVN